MSQSPVAIYIDFHCLYSYFPLIYDNTEDLELYNLDTTEEIQNQELVKMMLVCRETWIRKNCK